MKKIKNKNILLITILAWMLMIFIMSSLPIHKSNNISMNLESRIGNTLNIADGRVDINFIIRKTSHIFEYMILSILIYLYVGYYNKYNYFKTKKIILSVSISLLYAALDEFHQVFVPGRMGSIKDVLIDFVGIILGIIVVLVVSKNKNRK